MAEKKYDALEGTDQQAANAILAEIYGDTYPAIFTGSFDLTASAKMIVDYDISRAPAVAFNPGSQYQNDLDQAPFGVAFPAIDLTLKYTGGDVASVSGSIGGQAYAIVSSKGDLTFTITALQIVIPNDDALTAVLNKDFIPPLIAMLNEQLLAGIVIPPMDFLGVKMAPPAVQADNEYLVVISSLESTGQASLVGTTGPWPKAKPFLAMDEKMAEEITDALFKTYVEYRWESPKLKFDAKICEAEVFMFFDAMLTKATFEFRPGETAIKGRVYAEAKGGGEVKCVVKEQFGLKVTADAQATFELVVHDRKVELRILSVDSLYISPVEFIGIPSYLDPFSAILSDMILAAFKAWLEPVLAGMEITLYKIPELKFTVDGVEYEITLEDATTRQVEGPEDKPLLMVEATATLTVNP